MGGQWAVGSGQSAGMVIRRSCIADRSIPRRLSQDASTFPDIVPESGIGARPR